LHKKGTRRRLGRACFFAWGVCTRERAGGDKISLSQHRIHARVCACAQRDRRCPRARPLVHRGGAPGTRTRAFPMSQVGSRSIWFARARARKRSHAQEAFVLPTLVAHSRIFPSLGGLFRLSKIDCFWWEKRWYGVVFEGFVCFEEEAAFWVTIAKCVPAWHG